MIKLSVSSDGPLRTMHASISDLDSPATGGTLSTTLWPLPCLVQNEDRMLKKRAPHNDHELRPWGLLHEPLWWTQAEGWTEKSPLIWVMFRSATPFLSEKAVSKDELSPSS